MILRYRRDSIAVALIFAAALIIYLPVLLPGRVLLPTDLLMITPPWSQYSRELDPSFTHVLRRTWDPLFQVYPERKFLGDSLKQGWVPLWNPHIFSGTPFAADGQSAVFYPVNWLFAVLPLSFAFGAIAFLHSFLTGAFFYGYCRRIGCTIPGAHVGALVWMLCGVQIGWQMWQVVDSTLCWLPLCLFSWESFRKSQDLRYGLLFSFAVALTVLSGHLQFGFYSLLTVGAYALYRPIERVDTGYLRSCLTFVGYSALGLLLSAVQPLATADLLRLSIRNGAPIKQLLPSALAPAQLGLLIMPNIFGSEGDYVTHPFLVGEYYEKVLYCGASSLVFALFALRLRTKGDLSRFWAGIIIFSILMGCGAPLYSAFYWAVPLFKSFHGLSRVFVLFDFAIAALAALGISRLESESIMFRKRTAQVAAVAGVLICLIGYRLATLGNGPVISYYLTHPWLQYGLIQLMISLAFMIVAALVLLSVQQKFVWCAAAIVAVELLYFAVGLNPGGSSALLYPATPETEFVSAHTSSSPFDRVLCLSDGNPNRPQSRMEPNSAMSLGWNDVSGSDPLILTSYYDFVTMVNKAQSGAQEPAGQGIIADSGSPALDYLDVKWIVAPRLLQNAQYSLVAAGSINIYQNLGARGPAWLTTSYSIRPKSFDVDGAQSDLLTAGPEYFVARVPTEEPVTNVGGSTGAPIDFSTAGPDTLHLQVAADRPSLLVLSQTSCPGWRVDVDGRQKKTCTVDDLLTGLFISSGRHKITFTYDPAAIRLGLFGVCFGWLLTTMTFVLSAQEKMLGKSHPTA